MEGAMAFLASARRRPRRGAISSTPRDAPARPAGSGTFTLATWNIRHGGAGGLEAACRAFESLGVDIGVVQETKNVDGVHTQRSSGYSVFVSKAVSAHQGGVALIWRESWHYEVEETRIEGPNVLSFRIVSGELKFYVVGCYIPPSDLSTLDQVRGAWERCPKGFRPILLGDLNINLESPRDERDEEIAEQVDSYDLSDMGRQFSPRRRRLAKGRWTWRMKRDGRWISSQPDYLLARMGDRRRFKRVVLRDPRYSNSDHRATVATLWAGSERKMATYRRRHCRFPLRLPVGPRTQMEAVFEELKASVEVPPPRQRPANRWISDRTWNLVDRRAQLRRFGRLDQAESRRLGRQIHASLKTDRRQRAEAAAAEIEGHLAAGELQEAWNVAKRWYRMVEDRAPKPCYESMAKQTEERAELYAKRVPPGDSIPVNVDAYLIKDDTPSDLEIRAAVKDGLRNGRVGGASGIRSEDVKGWLRDAEEEERGGTEGLGYRWQLFVKLV